MTHDASDNSDHPKARGGTPAPGARALSDLGEKPSVKLPAPHTMLLIDGLGGVATAIMLCLVLPRFYEAIGLSPRLLVTLGLFGVVYGAYSLGSFRLVAERWRRALAIIIAANVFYCVVSALVVVTHRDAMTLLGISYFAAEIAVIAAIVGLEVAVLRRTAK